jgi:bifunctional oligoribonuclease and PAP phosphatase NrnA
MSTVFTPEKISAAKHLISAATKIIVTAHKSPDGDAVGSTLALNNFLLSIGKNSIVLLPDSAPDFLTWMSGAKDILIYDKNAEAAQKEIASADLIFSLDYNNLSRVGKEMEASLRAATAKFIMIDHHEQPEPYSQVTFSYTPSCSTAQLVYQFIDACGWNDKINNAIAECIYCGIMTDSGSFRFPSVTAETHRIVANLIESGLDHARVHREVYDTNLQDRLKLIGYALNEKLEVLADSATAFIYLTQEELQRFNHRQGDTEGLVNQALSIQGVKLAAFFREGNNEVKVSFRSKGSFDVNAFARANWRGGGHMNAAGGITQESMEIALKRFRQEVADLKETITAS